MQPLSNFPTVVEALKQVVAESDVNNGTQGVELMAHFWQQEYVYDEARETIRTDIAKAILQNRLDEVPALQAKLEALERPKVVMEFKLLTPIPRINGTKVMYDGQKTYKLTMEHVTSLFISEDVVKLGLLEYEETEDMAKDAQGRDAKVIKLRLKKGIIDLTAPIRDRKGAEIRPKRAYVTAISYAAMQVAGKIMYNEQLNKRRLYGYDEQQ
jgi:hypothetical protein